LVKKEERKLSTEAVSTSKPTEYEKVQTCVNNCDDIEEMAHNLESKFKTFMDGKES